MALLDKAKAVCRVTSTAYDDEITDLIGAGFADLGICDIDSALLTEDDAPALVVRALMTYVSMNFKLNNGQVDSNTYDKLNDSYSMQKSQMLMSSDYTEWSED